MKSASNFWIFFLLSSLLFNCATRKTDLNEALPMQKAYVLLRTEGLEAQINELTSILNSNFVTNRIASDINYYPLGRTWNINQIFSTAYDNKYDYIILIDQVAKFTIDKRTKVGGKYQIRSYHIKSTNPDWVDLGHKTCNISVRESIDKFSQQIISQIVPNYIPSKVPYNEGPVYADKQQPQISEIDYNQLKSSKEIDIEIVELREQLEKEKERTNNAIAEKERLLKEYDQALNFQKKKNQTVLEGLESFKKEKELAEVNQIEGIKKEEQKLKEELALVETKILERQGLKKERLEEERKEEEKRLEEIGLKELEKKVEEDRVAKAKLIEERRLEKERLSEAKRLVEIRLKELEKKAEEDRVAKAKLIEEKRLEEERLAESKQLEGIKLKELEKKSKEEQLAESKLTENQPEDEIKSGRKKKREKKIKDQMKKEIESFENTKILKENNSSVLVENKTKKSSGRNRKNSSDKTSESSMKLKTPIDKSNALLIIRGKVEDFDSFNKLKDNLEFELLFANIKTTTQIINLKEVLNKKDILNWNKTNYKYLIFIEQFDTVEVGSSNFGISVYPSNSNLTWKNLEQRPFNLNDRTSLKEFSKTVLKSL